MMYKITTYFSTLLILFTLLPSLYPNMWPQKIFVLVKFIVFFYPKLLDSTKFVKCHCAESHCAECYNFCRYAECHQAECCSAFRGEKFD